jgi:hypothetical protein
MRIVAFCLRASFAATHHQPMRRPFMRRISRRHLLPKYFAAEMNVTSFHPDSASRATASASKPF